MENVDPPKRRRHSALQHFAKKRKRLNQLRAKDTAKDDALRPESVTQLFYPPADNTIVPLEVERSDTPIEKPAPGDATESTEGNQSPESDGSDEKLASLMRTAEIVVKTPDDVVTGSSFGKGNSCAATLAASPITEASELDEVVEGWGCERCTLWNAAKKRRCHVCNARRPPSLKKEPPTSSVSTAATPSSTTSTCRSSGTHKADNTTQLPTTTTRVVTNRKTPKNMMASVDIKQAPEPRVTSMKGNRVSLPAAASLRVNKTDSLQQEPGCVGGSRVLLQHGGTAVKSKGSDPSTANNGDAKKSASVIISLPNNNDLPLSEGFRPPPKLSSEFQSLKAANWTTQVDTSSLVATPSLSKAVPPPIEDAVNGNKKAANEFLETSTTFAVGPSSPRVEQAMYFRLEQLEKDNAHQHAMLTAVLGKLDSTLALLREQKDKTQQFQKENTLCISMFNQVMGKLETTNTMLQEQQDSTKQLLLQDKSRVLQLQEQHDTVLHQKMLLEQNQALQLDVQSINSKLEHLQGDIEHLIVQIPTREVSVATETSPTTEAADDRVVPVAATRAKTNAQKRESPSAWPQSSSVPSTTVSASKDSSHKNNAGEKNAGAAVVQDISKSLSPSALRLASNRKTETTKAIVSWSQSCAEPMSALKPSVTNANLPAARSRTLSAPKELSTATNREGEGEDYGSPPVDMDHTSRGLMSQPSPAGSTQTIDPGPMTCSVTKALEFSASKGQRQSSRENMDLSSWGKAIERPAETDSEETTAQPERVMQAPDAPKPSSSAPLQNSTNAKNLKASLSDKQVWISNKSSRQFMREMDNAVQKTNNQASAPKASNQEWLTAPRPMPKTAAPRATSAFQRPDSLWDESQQPNYPYKEVVRCRAHRSGLQCHDCEGCRRFFQTLKDTGHEFSQDPLQFSRHRSRFALTETPQDFWEIDFIDELKSERESKAKEAADKKTG